MRPWPLAMLLVVACAPAHQATDARPVLRITGAETVMARLMPMLTQTHQQTVGTLHFDLTPDSTADGIRALLDGRADIAAAGRKDLPAEEEQAKVNGYSLDARGARTIVAMDVVALASNPRNPLDSLTYDQVIGIWCTGTIGNWSAFGLNAAPIRALTPPPLSGNRALFEDFFCGPAGISPEVEVVSEKAMKGILADDPNAIGYTSMAEISGKILGLRPDPDGPAVHPSQQNVVRGSYPLYHDLYLYTPGPATGPAKVFLDWIATPAGQEVVDQARFVPLYLRTERMDEPRPLRETIQFQRGSSTPTQRSTARLGMLVDELRARAGEYRHVVLEGYADEQEPDPVALSKARAEAVRGLLDQQLPGLFYEIIPRGSENPIAPNETPYGRLRNRRVQIYLAEEERGGEIVVHEPSGSGNGG